MEITFDKLLEYDTEQLWLTVQVMIRDHEEFQDNQDIELIKQGRRIKVPIYYLANKWYEVYPSSFNVQIYGFGKFNINDFMEEKEYRDTLMRKIISDMMDEEPTQPRI